MVRLLLRAFLPCLLLFPLLTLAQEVEISVDRTELARGDTLDLTIRIYQQRQNIQLDLSPLDADFDVLATRTSSQIRAFNGQSESWVDYIITLFPTREGEIEIPSLEIDGQTTAPIAISIVDQGPNSNQPDNDLFLETEVNKESIYVQEQLLFTIRLFYTISGIRNPQFTELEMPDSVIQMIGSPNQYERLIDGVRYGVYEKRYVIFPQRSGPLEIPDILFRGEVTDGSSNFVFRNLNTQRVTAYIEGLTIDVKERPAAARDLAFWLPAGNVTVEETWDPEPGTLQVGDTVTRTIRLQADGLDGAMLPPFSPTEVEGVNLYPEPSDVQRTFVDGQIAGTRVESSEIVPTRTGVIEVPQVRIPWWDINTDELRYAFVPGTRLNVASVAGAAPAEQSIADTGEDLNIEANAPALDQSMIDDQQNTQLINIPVIWLNLFITGAVLIVLASIYLLVVRRFDVDPLAGVRLFLQRQAENRLPENNESVAFGALLKAIRLKDISGIRATLITWAAHYFAPERVYSMDDIIRLTSGTALAEFCVTIQSALYNESPDQDVKIPDIRDELLRLRRLRKQSRRETRQQENFALPPLYRV